ncbi:MAG TPA: DUF4097 family beta strand repeat-containing protein [Jatrophihabitans sp.]|nr:DUF4097 family beta strand repeat-containing protein [Jatrophihabitans sp.]
MPDFEFPLTGPINLSCRLGGGSLAVHAESGLDRARVTAQPRDPRTDVLSRSTIELRGDQLVVHVPDEGAGFGHTGRRDDVDLVLHLPEGTPIRLAAGSAEVTVHGLVGAVDSRTGSSTVTIADIDGDLASRTGSGDLRVRSVTGSVMCKGGSGDVQLGEVGGDLAVTLGSGDLRLGTSGGSVRMRSGSGVTEIGSLSGDADVTSGSGRVSIGLAAGVQARLDARTGSGQVRTEMPLEESGGRGSAIRIRVRTGSGDVIVHRATAAEVPVAG